MNDEVTTNPTHTEGLRHLKVLLTSAAVTRAVGKMSGVLGAESVTDGQVVLKTDVKWLSTAFVTCLRSVTNWLSISRSTKELSFLLKLET
jgi:hypothetical protein